MKAATGVSASYTLRVTVDSNRLSRFAARGSAEAIEKLQMLKRSSFTVLLLLLLSTPAFAQSLSGDVIPSHYDIAVAPDLQAATFSGTERIVVSLKKPSSSIVLNAAEIEFGKVTVTSAGKTSDARVTLDP